MGARGVRVRINMLCFSRVGERVSNVHPKYRRQDFRQFKNVSAVGVRAAGGRGKWFAAAKGEGFLDVAVSRARDFSVEPVTLVRAARDFAVKEPRFAAEIGLVALQRLLDGSGYDPAVSLVREAPDHLLDAASRIGAQDCAKEQAPSLVDAPLLFAPGHVQRVLAESLVC